MTSPAHPDIAEQITLLQKCQKTQRSFSADLASARQHIAQRKQELEQASQALDQAKAISKMESLLDPALTNDTLRKAAVEAGWANSQAVLEAQSELRTATRALQDAEDALEKIRDLRRSCEYAQTAGVAIIHAYQIKGEANATSSRQQPEQYRSH